LTEAFGRKTVKENRPRRHKINIGGFSMGTYTIPRNLKGETRLLIIFSVKSLISTAGGLLIGLLFYLLIAKGFGQETAGLVVLAIFGVLGFAAGAFNIPTIAGLPVTKKIGGEPVYEIVYRYFKFKMSKKKYSYFITKEGEK